MKKPLLAAIAAASILALGACTQETRVEDETPAEQSADNAGAALEQSAQNAGDSIEQSADRAGDNLEQAGDNAANSVDNATDGNPNTNP
jgi:hypothetical protein